jgi:energy-coupling factor transport system permease protein
MIATAPLAADPRAPIARAHPVPKLAAAIVLMAALFVTVDPVTSLVILGGILLAVPLSGLPPGSLARRVAPLALVATGIAVFNTLLSDRAGDAVAFVGPFRITLEAVIGGIAAALRIFGIALSGVLVLATIDPTDLADALVEHVRASPRFVLGALAAWRLAPIFGREWWTLGLARRARGIETRGLGGLRAFPGQTFGLLVGAIRRGTELALAMDARGFGQRRCRTLARPRPILALDWTVLAAAVALAASATALSIALGQWRPLWSP